MRVPKPKLPEDLMEPIFSYAQPYDILRGRALSDATSMIKLCDLPQALRTLEKVTELDTTTPISGIQPCREALLKPFEVMSIVSTAKNLRKIRVSHVSGSCFIPFLKHVEEIEFRDSEDVDITHIASSVSVINVHEPTHKTLATLAQIGCSLRDVTFTDVNPVLIANVTKVLDRWGTNITSITVFVKSVLPYSERGCDLGLKTLTSYLATKDRQLFRSLRVLRLGRYDEINCEPPVDIIRKLECISSFCDTEFVSFRPPLSPSGTYINLEIPRKVTAFEMESYNKETGFLPIYFQVQELILLGPQYFKIQFFKSKGTLRYFHYAITEMASLMKTLTHLSIRTGIIMKEAGINCYVFNFIRFFLYATDSINLLEVTKDFILVPMVCKDMAKLLFSAMTKLRTLVIVNIPRKIYHCREDPVEETNNQTIAEAIPSFLELLREYCPGMECVFLSDCGAMEVTELHKSKVTRNVVQAMEVTEKFEKANTQVDISTVKAQIRTWLRSLLLDSSKPQTPIESMLRSQENQN